MQINVIDTPTSGMRSTRRLVVSPTSQYNDDCYLAVSSSVLHAPRLPSQAVIS